MSAESLHHGHLVAAQMNTAVPTKSAGSLTLAVVRGTAPRRAWGHPVARTIASPTSAVAAPPPGASRSVLGLPLIIALARISLAVALREEATLTADGRGPAGAVSSPHARTGTSEGHS